MKIFAISICTAFLTSRGKIIIIGSNVVLKLKFCLDEVRARRPGYDNIATRLGTEFRMTMRARAAPLQIISTDMVVKLKGEV